MAQRIPSEGKRSAAAETPDAVMRHHRLAWRIERIGWAVMAALLTATLFGAFGDGPLSRAQDGSARTLSVEYDRLLRSSAPAQYRFQAHPSVATKGALRLRFDQSLVDHMELDSIVPAPERQEAGSGYTDFIFRVAAAGSSARIEFRFRPASFGRHTGRVSVAGARPVVIDQFVYP